MDGKYSEKFISGQKVKNQYGEIETIRIQIGNQVFTYENINSWYHPEKLIAL